MTNANHRRWRLGVVSYLNAKPLIEGLDADPEIDLLFDVPARLPAMLDSGDVDAALVPVIDLLDPARNWRIISDACIGCDGETLTVRVFSRVPPQRVHRLYVDGDSHTSVALARVVWPGLFGHSIETRPLANARSTQNPQDAPSMQRTDGGFASEDTRTDPLPYSAKITQPSVLHPRTSEDGALTGIFSPQYDCIGDDDGVLLIGDKVVTHAPTNLEIETDLGSCWKSLTSLPFVFAAWAIPNSIAEDTALLADKLSRARDAGVASAELIAADFGPGHGWPVTLAKRYLASRLKFHLGPRQRLGMRKFLELAKEQRLVAPAQELIFA